MYFQSAVSYLVKNFVLEKLSTAHKIQEHFKHRGTAKQHTFGNKQLEGFSINIR